MKAGEPGVGGVTIYVDYNDNAKLDSGEPSAVTAADGTYTNETLKKVFTDHVDAYAGLCK